MTNIFLVIWEDEADYRRTFTAFKNREDAITFMINEYIDIDEIPEGKLNPQQRYELADREEVFPPSVEYDCGCYYYHLEEIILN